ncbi:hypothetical protein BC830DRAFT_1175304 [Chytriomyces sp. MP71]|nr:hypothetical protein BC830DRAFT_1175304 [Chytriomyces sp. MP71]
MEDCVVPAPYLPPCKGEGDTSNFDQYPEDHEPYGVAGPDPHKDKFEGTWVHAHHVLDTSEAAQVDGVAPDKLPDSKWPHGSNEQVPALAELDTSWSKQDIPVAERRLPAEAQVC